MIPHVTFRHQAKDREPLGRYWILPGGLTFEVADGNLYLRGEAQGFLKPHRMGDPTYASNGMISMPWAAQNSSGPDFLYFGRFAKSATQYVGGTYFAGPWGGMAGEFASVQIEDREETLPGFFFPRISFGYPGGFTASEKYGTWGLDQQYPSAGSFQEGWQAWYSRGMTYSQGMIAARKVAYMFGPRSEGGPYIGACHDGAAFRYLPKPSTDQLRAVVKAAGVYPDDDEAIPGRDLYASDSFGFDLIRPIGIVDEERVLVSGVLHYSGKFERFPHPSERPYYMRGRPGYGNESWQWSLPLLDGPMSWYWGGTDPNYLARGPVSFQESASALIYFTAVAGRMGLEEISVTGVAGSYSRVCQYMSGFNPYAFTVFKRISDGGYDVFWSGAPNPPTYPFTTGGTPYVTPNGWTIYVHVPAAPGNPSVRDTRYYLIPVWANDPTFRAIAPTKPTNAPADWVPPEFDPPPELWRGMKFRDIRDGTDRWVNGTNDTFLPLPNAGSAVELHGAVPTSDAYRRPGEHQDQGEGEFVVSLYGSKSVSTIKAPIGNKVSVISDPGGDPVMRYFEGPNGFALRKTQYGQWQIRQGLGWAQSLIDFGEVAGTLTVIHDFTPPQPPPS